MIASSRHRIGMLAAFAMCAVLAGATAAQADDSVDAAAAKKEGRVVWYTSNTVETANKMAKQFESDTGVKVEVFRSGGSAILRRFQQEVQAGRIAADVLTVSDPAATNALARKGTFVAFKPANFDRVPETLRDPEGRFVAHRLNLIAIFARSDKVKDAPKTWSDLADPKYKGQIVTSDPSYTALGLMTVATLAKRLGWDYYKKLRANDIMIVQSNQQVTDMLKRGERVIGVGLDTYATEERRAGHPIETIYPTDGVLVISSPAVVVKGSPNPNAAKLFAQFLLGDAAQRYLVEDGAYAPRIDMPPPDGNPKLSDLTLMSIDYDEVERDAARIKRQFNEIFQ